MSDLAQWLERVFGRKPGDIDRYRRALTHSSHGDPDYERLEFLGDRVLGLSVAEWLYEIFPDEPEGNLSKRFNALVSGATCADIARALGARERLILGKQARDDGADDSDNVLGDVVESLLGAYYLEAGFDAARAWVRRTWADRVHMTDKAPQHPKSQLQEWAAANNRAVPEYSVTDRSGPQHAPRFTVAVRIGKRLEATATGASKQEAETAAAQAMLRQVREMTPVKRKRRVTRTTEAPTSPR